ncbi:hypothetical protein ONZ45_g19067 [Pleurotus djamor]|nr:hypothetical protein ONZ45_g19067 [Pleurotus djamor]
MIQPNEALLICAFFLSSLHGIYTILIIFAIYLVCFRNRRSSSNPHSSSSSSITGRNLWGLGIIIFQYLLATAHLCMAFYQDVVTIGRTDPGPFAEVQYVGRMAFSQIAMLFLSCFLADILLTWRTFITTFGYVGALIHGLSLPLNPPNLEGLFLQAREPPISTWTWISIAFSVFTNVFLSGMTSTRLWFHQRKMKKIHGFSSLLFESAVIIESGLLYTFAWISYFVLFLLKSNGDIVAMDVIGHLSGIVPALIIVIVSAGLTPVRSRSPVYPKSSYNRNRRPRSVTENTIDLYKSTTDDHRNTNDASTHSGLGTSGYKDDECSLGTNTRTEMHFSENPELTTYSIKTSRDGDGAMFGSDAGGISVERTVLKV